MHKIDRQHAGKKFRCPKCQRKIRLGAAEPPEIHFERVADEETPAAVPGNARLKGRRWRPAASAGVGIAFLVAFTVGSVALVAAFDRVDYRPPTLVGKWKTSDADVVFHFRGDGSASYSGARKALAKIGLSSSGPWQVDTVEGDVLKIRMGPAEQPFPATLVFEDANTFTFTREMGDKLDPMFFSRVKE